MERHCGTLGSVIFFLMGLTIAYATEPGPHMFKESECQCCHATDSAHGPKNVSIKSGQAITTMCTRCHQAILTEGYLHPVDVKPQKAIPPQDLPLSMKGEITCATCHDIHKPRFTAYSTLTYFLRGERGKGFCQLCHQSSPGERGHKELGTAHLGAAKKTAAPSGTIDSLSKECISCHDGSLAPSAKTKHVGSADWVEQRHPIGVDYESARLKKGRKVDLKPIMIAGQKAKFFDGQLGCGSCHDPYAPISKRLVMADQQSKLCFNCHTL